MSHREEAPMPNPFYFRAARNRLSRLTGPQNPPAVRLAATVRLARVLMADTPRARLAQQLLQQANPPTWTHPDQPGFAPSFPSSSPSISSRNWTNLDKSEHLYAEFTAPTGKFSQPTRKKPQLRCSNSSRSPPSRNTPQHRADRNKTPPLQHRLSPGQG